MKPSEAERGVLNSHCWHRGMLRLASSPPKDELQCCHCGLKLYVGEQVPESVEDPDHGPYAPLRVVAGAPPLGEDASGRLQILEGASVYLPSNALIVKCPGTGA